MKKRETVFVGMSGGVDSSVSAALLKEEGYQVVGVFIKVWHPDFLLCEWERERIDAIRVCVELGIPLLTLDLEEEYKRDVADYLIREYKKGKTPNPDVMCNKYVKFGAFFDFARKRGADYVATGHYARIEKNGCVYKLLQGIDQDKDQSYFLWTLTEEHLKHTLFPIGGFKKEEVRKLAKKYGLEVAEKKDSQGICFLGHIDLREFLGHYLDLKEGKVFTPDGKLVGTHYGAEVYTLGQRHGFIINEKDTLRSPYYVVAKDTQTNTLTVAHNPLETNFRVKKTLLESVHWIGDAPEEGKEYQARIRHRGKLLPCLWNGKEVLFNKPQAPLSGGQSLVLYNKEECLGGGIIS